MRITVVGGGGIGSLAAAQIAARGHQVSLVVSDPDNWVGFIDVFDSQNDLLTTGHLALVTSCLEEAVKAADYILVTYPAFLLESFAKKLLPLVAPGMRIGLIPGNNGEFFFSRHVNRGAILFGLQRVHSIARVRQRGCSVCELGRKESIQVAAIPSCHTDEIARDLQELFAMPAEGLPNYLVETLTPSNAILHTARIRQLFRSWKPGDYYDRNFLFYEEWDRESSELLLACDDELQRACRCLEKKLGLDLSQVKSLRDHYQVQDADSMAKKISSIPAFKGLTSPMREESPGKWVPDFSNRYFKADFPYGLRAIRDIAALAKVNAPFINDVYHWYTRVSYDKVSFDAVPATLGGLALLYPENDSKGQE